jgi:dienelactone hydrolase
MALALTSAVAGAEPVQVGATPSGVRYGLWPDRPPGQKPAPTLVVLASTIEETLGHPYYRQAGNDLAARGYLCVSVDLPCHGAEVRPGEPAGLGGWRRRCDGDEDFIAPLVSRLRAVLDHLVAEGVADPARIAACGTSRGGFAALHFAAAEPRVACVAAFAPVVDLAALSEFRGAEEAPAVRRLALEGRLDPLAGRPVWLIIGDRDARVGTDRTISLARRLTARSLEAGKSPRVDLHVVAEPKGHTTPAGAAGQAADWIDRQLRAPR